MIIRSKRLSHGYDDTSNAVKLADVDSSKQTEFFRILKLVLLSKVNIVYAVETFDLERDDKLYLKVHRLHCYDGSEGNTNNCLPHNNLKDLTAEFT